MTHLWWPTITRRLCVCVCQQQQQRKDKSSFSYSLAMREKAGISGAGSFTYTRHKHISMCAELEGNTFGPEKAGQLLKRWASYLPEEREEIKKKVANLHQRKMEFFKKTHSRCARDSLRPSSGRYENVPTEIETERKSQILHTLFFKIVTRWEHDKSAQRNSKT